MPIDLKELLSAEDEATEAQLLEEMRRTVEAVEARQLYETALNFEHARSVERVMREQHWLALAALAGRQAPATPPDNADNAGESPPATAWRMPPDSRGRAKTDDARAPDILAQQGITPPIPPMDAEVYAARCRHWATKWLETPGNKERMVGHAGFDACRKRLCVALKRVILANTAT